VFLALAVVLGYGLRRMAGWPPMLAVWFERVFSLGWCYALVRRIYGLFGRGVLRISRLLEGDGGLLWALVLLALLISVFGAYATGG